MGAGAVGRQNNFDALRLLAAAAVIVSHAFPLTGHAEPLKEAIGYSGGWLAVNAFFTMSGYLIYRSMDRSQSAKVFLRARLVRIMPGLWGMLAVIVLLLGVFASTLSPAEFFAHPSTSNYVLKNAVFIEARDGLPGVFEANPLAYAVNGSLWTLRFEFACYLLVLGTWLIGGWATPRRFLALVALALVGYAGFIGAAVVTETTDSALHDGSTPAKMHRLFFAFLLGMLVARLGDFRRVRPWHLLVLLAASALTLGTVLFPTALILATAAAVFVFAGIDASPLRALRGIPDVSYGLYIYAFPVQQVVAMAFPQAGPAANAALTLSATVPMAALSWYGIERPSLRAARPPQSQLA